MGWYFQLEEANIVAYLTTLNAKRPELKYADLSNFLRGLSEGWKEAFISSDEKWPETMGRKAAHSLESVAPSVSFSAEVVPSDQLERLIGPLREELQKYAFYALAVFDQSSSNLNERLLAFMKNGAYESEAHGLFLITDHWRNFNYGFLDPFPPIQEIAKHPGNVPGVVFWNDGSEAFVHVNEAGSVLHDIIDAARTSRAAITEVLNAHNLGPKEKQVLHLSDLHCGTSRATELQEYLVSSIAREAKSVDRVVVTGDLFDTPNKDAMNQFLNLRYSLERITNKDVVVIPGNHDESFKGNRLWGVGKQLDPVSTLEWSSLVIDDDMRCVFFGFDSALDANFSAQGLIAEEQLIRLGTQYQTRLDRNGDLSNYLSVALVHHHPFSWTSGEPRILGVSLENLLYMKEADRFLHWCVRRGIPLVLHGHKHKPRHVVEYIRTDDLSGWVNSVGCGSSLGAGNGPLSYNILSWHPQTRNWSASFFVDPGDASGFKRRYVSITNAKSN